MPKFLKYVLYFIGGYALILGLLALMTSNSKCNILGGGGCGAFDAIYMVMLTPLVIPSVMLENKKEEKRIAQLQVELKEGVLKGDRESIESCIDNGCFLGPPIDDPNPQDTAKYERIAAQKLITFDYVGMPPLEDRKQEYMMMAYWKLSQAEEFGSEKYKKYINRAWQLLAEYNTKNENKLNIYSEVITGVGGSAFLLNYGLFDKAPTDKTVQNAFEGCMLDPFWKQAKYSSQEADTEILHSCMDAISEFVYEKKIDKNIKKEFDEKWHAQGRTFLNFCSDTFS